MAAEPASEVYLNTIFLCIPLRLGVLISAFFTVLTSFLYLCDKESYLITFRHFTGGYTHMSRFAVGVTEVLGVLFGPVGVVGAWFQRRDYVLTFSLWQFLRLAAWVFVYAVDIPLLSHCEDWVNDVKWMSTKYGWHQNMFDIAMAGHCEVERQAFFTLSFLTLAVFMYLVAATLRLHEFMGRQPRHLLRVPKDLSSGAFYSHSLGERAHLIGAYGKQEYTPPQDRPLTGLGAAGQPGGFVPAGQV
mmetsp:Transcript_104641/g.326371  ORF Transcript_104641/g.326371 Transcript_104641/m.326371 type:complete len:245 (+) Transcript_104641:168-902(+)